MSFWDRVSNATRRAPGAPGMGGAAAASAGRLTGNSHFKTWSALVVSAGLIYIIYTGLLEMWVTTFLNRLLALVRPLDLVFVLVSALAISAGVLLMKLTPQDHPLSIHGHRVATRIGPTGIVVGVGLLPVVLIVMTLGQSGSLQLVGSYLGIKPAANLCQSVGVGATPPPVVASAPHR